MIDYSYDIFYIYYFYVCFLCITLIYNTYAYYINTLCIHNINTQCIYIMYRKQSLRLYF